jgi:hypothetical protein
MPNRVALYAMAPKALIQHDAALFLRNNSTIHFYTVSVSTEKHVTSKCVKSCEGFNSSQSHLSDLNTFSSFFHDISVCNDEVRFSIFVIYDVLVLSALTGFYIF